MQHTIGIETRATVPSKALVQLEEELFSLGFAGSLAFSGVGILPNGIIVRSEKQNDEPEITVIEFSYPPFKNTDNKILESIYNQHSVFFHMIKKYGGNPYPWYINLEEEEERITGYKTLKLARGIAKCSINPIHITLTKSLSSYFFYPSSLGEVNWNGVFRGPLLAIVYKDVENLKYFVEGKTEQDKRIDVREFTKDYSFEKIPISFGVRINRREFEDHFPIRGFYHFALSALPQDTLPQVTQIEKAREFGKILHSIFSSRSSEESHPTFIEEQIRDFILLQGSTLNEIANEIKNLPSFKYFDRVPIYEVISNANKFKSIAARYLEEKWGATTEPLIDAYSLLLSEVDYVEKVIRPVDVKIYEVTDYPIVNYKEGWLSDLAKKHKIEIHHKLEGSNPLLVNYNITLKKE
jgi:hypothetical protein